MGQLCNVICLLASSTSAMCCPCFNQAACWAKVVVIIGFVFAPIMMIVMLPLAPGIREGNIFTELCLGGTYCFHDTRFDEDSLELFIGAEMYANMNDNTVSGYASVKEYGPAAKPRSDTPLHEKSPGATNISHPARLMSATLSTLRMRPRFPGRSSLRCPS